MSSKASYNPVGKTEPQSGADAETGDKTKSDGFTVRVRRMDKKWIMLGGAAAVILVAVVVAVVVVLMKTGAESESEQLRRMNRPAFCAFEPEAGMCRAYFEVYHYDPKTDSCKEFVYGGCEGNENRFNTIEECEKTCLAGVKGVKTAKSDSSNEHSSPGDVKISEGDAKEDTEKA